MSDQEFLICSATRYTLGRQTYAVGIMCAILKRVSKTLTDNAREVIIRDIETQEKYGYGADWDRTEWMEALEVLKNDRSKV